MSMESRKFEAAGMMEAISAAEYYQYAFVDGHENASLAPVTSTFPPSRPGDERPDALLET